MRLERGKGRVWAGEEAVEGESENEESHTFEEVELTDLRQLGINTLGALKEHPRIKRLRDFLKGWYLSYFYPMRRAGCLSPARKSISTCTATT